MCFIFKMGWISQVSPVQHTNCEHGFLYCLCYSLSDRNKPCSNRETVFTRSECVSRGDGVTLEVVLRNLFSVIGNDAASSHLMLPKVRHIRSRTLVFEVTV